MRWIVSSILFGESAGEVYLKATLEPVRKTDVQPANQLGARCDVDAQGSPKFRKYQQTVVACQTGMQHKLAKVCSKSPQMPNVADDHLKLRMTQAMQKVQTELVKWALPDTGPLKN